ncbi:MAG: hypothetical protein QF460_00455 [Candidatus Nanoarchaeia archaeon]|nr:hypothetical protein [Candidatus Nanoarchaeia archaeon]
MADYVALMYSQQRSKMTTSMSDGDLQNKLNSELGAGGKDILRVTVSSVKGGGLAFFGSVETVTVGVVVDSSKVDQLKASIDSTLSSHGFNYKRTDKS